MATRQTGRNSVAARTMKNCRKFCKYPNNSFHPSIPRKPLAVPWCLNATEDETAHQNEAEVEFGNVETFGGSSLHSFKYMLPKPLEGLDMVEKHSQLRFHNFEEVRSQFVLGA